MLGLIESNPSDEWLYSYRYPSDCISLRRIVSTARRDTLQTRLPFKILKDSVSKIIYTDQENAQVEYTEMVTDPKFFSPEFVIALSFKLAHYIAPRLTKGDPFKLKNDMLVQYQLEIGRAKSKNMNEEIQDRPPESQAITIRN